MITIDGFSETEMPTPFAPFSNPILLMSAEPIAVVKGWGFPNILEAYKTLTEVQPAIAWYINF
ncbi:hypothetical protein LCIT_20190 [Leuconostoc citreum]|uniref:Uncharacterized protein n=1 Tax=Leuconostoc citreum TaxID=33964 RepID=A0A5A5U1E0_LEUCI|nr:hypothetical protein LCIT_20190 [Leuconostoc citreum]GDZ85695.1 hypothetical protein LCTS_08940 [Leuconostoc citreum]